MNPTATSALVADADLEARGASKTFNGVPDPSDALVVDGLSGGQVVDVGFRAQAGEILGFVGLPGEGFDEIPYLLSGAARANSGTVTIGDVRLALPCIDPATAIRHGMALLRADRNGAGGQAGLVVGEHLTPPATPWLTALGALWHRRKTELVARERIRFVVDPDRVDATFQTFSGDSRRRATMANWAATDPSVLVFHEPTQGIDVGTMRDVFTQLEGLSRNGATLLISSVEYEDLADICTRVHLVRNGVISRTFVREELTAHALAMAVHE